MLHATIIHLNCARGCCWWYRVCSWKTHHPARCWNPHPGGTIRKNDGPARKKNPHPGAFAWTRKSVYCVIERFQQKAPPPSPFVPTTLEASPIWVANSHPDFGVLVDCSLKFHDLVPILHCTKQPAYPKTFWKAQYGGPQTSCWPFSAHTYNQSSRNRWMSIPFEMCIYKGHHISVIGIMLHCRQHSKMLPT